jgi:hypothetical protein
MSRARMWRSNSTGPTGIAAELVRRQVAVIVANTTGVMAVKAATTKARG